MRQSLPFVAAFASGGLLTLMVLFNGQWAASGTALLASWMAHGTGTIAALVFLGILRVGRRVRPAPLPVAPAWAYLGGLSGAVTVMLTSTTVNGILALSGTLALGLVGQAGYSLLADRFGLFGLPRRRIELADWGAILMILGGSFLIIFAGGR
ncbi:DMT family transporter [Ostreiculturibacter nitratireducens]|uniref:DMT family transporter n=1 Tax=Ostreiculturibacter nitratireducens TaxID=3075226 RepID=UPI0031B58B37